MEENVNAVQSEQDLENRILAAVAKIKSNRNRPGYVNIHGKIIAGGDVAMEKLKEVICSLVKKGRLIQKLTVKDDTEVESFSLAEDKDFIQEKEEQTKLLNKIDKMEQYINNIELIVKEEVDKKFKLLNIVNIPAELQEIERRMEKKLQLNHDNNVVQRASLKNATPQRELPNVSRNSACSTDRDNLLNALHAEINFLRNEVKSKDEIIKILASDRKHNVKTSVIKSITQDDNNKNKSRNSNNTSSSGNNNNIKNKTIRKRSELLSVAPSSDEDEDCYEKVEPKKKSSSRKVTICGDSIIKNIYGYDINKSVANTKTYVKSNSGATVEDMKDYVKPSLRHNPDLFIIHCGTNDLRSRSIEEVATDVVGLAVDARNDENEVAVSSLTIRNDKLEEKRIQVNDLLKRMCKDAKIGYVDHSNIKKTHLNNSGLHLNADGEKVLKKNFISFINL